MINSTTIHHLIEKQALVNPNAIAISDRKKNFPYSVLNERANQLAHLLIARGVAKESLVAISLNRTAKMIIALLAVLKAGGAYLPIDPLYPKERINYMLSNSKARLLLTDNPELIENLDIEKIDLNNYLKKIHSFPNTNPEVPIVSNNLAYVLYTSGTTGIPKGVMISHENLFYAYESWKNAYDLVGFDNHLQMANFSFDVFSGDYVRALCSGSTLVLCPREYLLEPEKLYRLMKDKGITCAEFVPTVLRKLIEYIELTGKSLEFMRLLICGSDNWSMNEYRKVKRLCGSSTRVINSYGVTEATIDSTYFEEANLEQGYIAIDHAVPIGKPFRHTEIYLLNEKLHIVGENEIGEIFIGGKGLARGYFGQSQLTDEKFIPHPFKSNEKLYKTGDLGRYLSNGNIEFLGRVDNQVKIRGIRVELSDIENTLNCYPEIKESLVLFYGNESQHKRLIAYLVTDVGVKIDLQELRKFLNNHLPYYMIPSIFMRLNSLPTTPNGKLDRLALKTAPKIEANIKSYVKPRSPIENQLVKLWKRLLDLEDIDIFQQFWELGGDSILVTTLLSEIEKIFFVKIGIEQISCSLTVAELAKSISAALGTLPSEVQV